MWPMGPNVPVWKSSELAVLLKGFKLGDMFTGARTAKQLEERGKHVVAVLVDEEEIRGVNGEADFPLVEQRNGA